MPPPTDTADLPGRHAPRHGGPATLGVNVSFLFLGPFLNPWVVAPLNSAHGIEFAFSVIGIAYLIGGALFLIAILHNRRRAPAELTA